MCMPETALGVPKKADVESYCAKGKSCPAPQSYIHLPSAVQQPAFDHHVHSTTRSTEIKTHISQCKPGWTGDLCHQTCPNKLLPGQYYSSGENFWAHSCQVAWCTNAKTGEYYTGIGSDDRNSCPTAPCTNTPKTGLRFITSGGTSSTGCKIGGVYALSSVLICLPLIHVCMAQLL